MLLIRASGKGNLTRVKQLIAWGEDVNYQDTTKWSALHSASHEGYIEIVKELIKAGANVNVKNSNGATPLYMVSWGIYDRVEIAKELIKSGADVNVKYSGETLISTALGMGNLGIVEVLIQAGIDVNIQNSNGITVIHNAMNKGYFNIVDRLIQAGADVNIRNRHGVGLFRYAMKLKPELKSYQVIPLLQREGYRTTPLEIMEFLHVKTPDDIVLRFLIKSLGQLPMSDIHNHRLMYITHLNWKLYDAFIEPRFQLLVMCIPRCLPTKQYYSILEKLPEDLLRKLKLFLCV